MKKTIKLSTIALLTTALTALPAYALSLNLGGGNDPVVDLGNGNNADATVSVDTGNLLDGGSSGADADVDATVNLNLGNAGGDLGGDGGLVGGIVNDGGDGGVVNLGGSGGLVNLGEPVEFPAEGALWDLLGATLRDHDPEAIPVPVMAPFATDAKATVVLGTPTYGFSPLRLEPDERYLERYHAWLRG